MAQDTLSEFLGQVWCGPFVFFVLPTTPFVKALVRWAIGTRLTDRLPKRSLVTLGYVLLRR